MSDTKLTDLAQWEDGSFEWNVKTFYFVPLMVILSKPQKVFETAQRLRAEVESKGYTVKPDAIVLMEISAFKGRMMVEINKPDVYDASVYQLENSKMYTTVHHGPMKTVKQTANALKAHVESTKGVQPTTVYFWDFRHGPTLSGGRADKVVVLARI